MLRGTLMKTRPITEGKQMKQCVYSIPRECGRCYIGEISRPLEVCIKEHKYSLTQSLLEKSKLVKHAYEEHHKICCKEARSCKLNRIAHTENAGKQPIWLWHIIHSVNPAWTSLLIWTAITAAEVGKLQHRSCRLQWESCFYCWCHTKNLWF
jgi:hypothetical protein